MFPIVFLLVSTVLAAAELPRPELTIIDQGNIELHIEDLPGLESLSVKYSISGKEFQGSFYQEADRRWYHRNHVSVSYDGGIPLRYTLIGQVNGKLVVSKGKNTPAKGLAIIPPRRLVRGTVVFRDDFNGAFDPSGWNYEVSMYGGYNWEVQAYVPEARNVFTRDGHLFIKPTLTRDHPGFNDEKLYSGVMDMQAMYGYCTNADRWGCHREGRYGILPPVMSGKIKSKATIKFGSVEVRARTPCGDWIWPAIWMLPRDSVYGGWPRSGEIDMMESRGNSRAWDGGRNHGCDEVGATLHWGPSPDQNKWSMTHGTRNIECCNGMRTYRLDWTEDHIQVFVDNENMMNIPIWESFWQKGGFGGHNIWAQGSKAAPFDQPFYLILNVAVAGTNGYFPDNWQYNTPKPWRNDSPREPQEFWDARGNWLPTWRGDAVAMEIDYVQMIQY